MPFSSFSNRQRPGPNRHDRPTTTSGWSTSTAFRNPPVTGAGRYTPAGLSHFFGPRFAACPARVAVLIAYFHAIKRKTVRAPSAYRTISPPPRKKIFISRSCKYLGVQCLGVQCLGVAACRANVLPPRKKCPMPIASPRRMGEKYALSSAI